MDLPVSPLHVDLIVKFGGSAVTDKTKLETLDEESLCKAAELISQCHKQRLTCIVVHGAGSFGHHQAKEYNVNSGWNHFEDKNEMDHVKRGFCLTRKSVTMLNQHVVDSLLQQNIPAVGLSVCGEWVTEKGTVVKYSTNSVWDALRNGFIPVLHGDCVLDRVKGCNILSGDTIIRTLSEAFKVNRVVFLTSVKGVYNCPPENNSEDPSFRNSDQAVVKEAYAAMVTLVTEAAKHDLDNNSISSVLEECKYTSDRIDLFNKVYNSKKPLMQILLSSVGTSPPHIVDVDWRLDYYIKNNHLERVNEAVYLVSLKTEVPGSAELKEVQFSCTQEQLQDLVGKLKDACKCLEKVSQI